MSDTVNRVYTDAIRDQIKQDIIDTIKIGKLQAMIGCIETGGSGSFKVYPESTLDKVLDIIVDIFEKYLPQ